MKSELTASYLKEADHEFIEVRGLPEFPRRYELISKHCKKCSTPLSREVGTCINCQSLGEVDAVIAMGLYISERKTGGTIGPQPLSEDIRESKERREYSRALGLALSEYLKHKQKSLSQFHLIVPVPSKSNKELVIAKQLEMNHGMKLRNDLLTYTPGHKQWEVAPNQRRAEAERKYHASDKMLRGESILLLDDVLTTSSTASRCAHELKRIGARRVVALVVSRDVSTPIIVDGHIIDGFAEERLPPYRKQTRPVSSSSVLEKSETLARPSRSQLPPRVSPPPKYTGFYARGESSRNRKQELKRKEAQSGFYTLHCPHCGAQFPRQVRIGVTVRCYSCGKTFSG